MNACATLARLAAPTSAATPPLLVLLAGIPEPRLRCVEFTLEGPADRRAARLELSPDADPAALHHRWSHQPVTIAQPMRLVDGSVHWTVLVHGRLALHQRDLSSARDRREFCVEDQWTTLLRQPVHRSWWQVGDRLLVRESPPRIGGPNGAERSAHRFPIHGSTAHVLAQHGEPWTLGTALETLSALAHLHLDLTALPHDLAAEPLPATLDLANPVGDALDLLLAAHHLVLRRDLSLTGSHVTDTRAIRPARHGRIVRIPWSDDARPLGHALAIHSDTPPAPAQQWIARAKGWLVESTFPLVPGWDPRLQGRDPSDYQPAAGSAFDLLANVYRLWALNEDGAFSPEPFTQGDPFDLGQLIDGQPVPPQPLRFEPCLTLDDGNARRSPILHVSLDAGATWAPWTGRWSLRADRAALRLDDPALPPDYLAAAAAGLARARLTAAVRSPAPVQCVQWRGNAFLGIDAPRLLDTHETFAFRKVHPSSLHHADLRAGVLRAIERDDTPAMNAWLLRQLDHPAPLQHGQATLTLAGCWTALRCGDQLRDAGGARLAPDHTAQTLARQTARVTRMRCRPNDDQTTVTLAF